ncbi:hypothetical protein Dsin_027471 [Dipteronia sinensis]|uniref:GYF domain-containing protein n=1 Tax=Dipteronia sinensis TaxID=43782 RepID=A0AAD9ZPF3_9ROSI|nr:hypothetical protein Dsin_027471 [Dipteronia sinensis]
MIILVFPGRGVKFLIWYTKILFLVSLKVFMPMLTRQCNQVQKSVRFMGVLIPVMSRHLVAILDETLHSSSVMETNCQSNGTSDDMPQSSSSGGASYSDKRYYVPPATVSGWTYVNESGQMCGPYIQQQLFEGLSTGFLPDELLVYPVVNGTLINPSPLKYFKLFPDHVSTGFAYLSAGSLSTAMTPNCSISHSGNMMPHSRREGLLQHSVPVTVESQSLVKYNSYISDQSKSEADKFPPVSGEDCLLVV